VRAALFISNIVELLLELSLYACLIKVNFILTSFLKSFDEQNVQNKEQNIIQQGRLVFKVVTATFIVIMVTNSVFSALSPYLWLGEVYSKNKYIVIFYTGSTTVFYLTNTFFACLVLYIIF